MHSITNNCGVQQHAFGHCLAETVQAADNFPAEMSTTSKKAQQSLTSRQKRRNHHLPKDNYDTPSRARSLTSPTKHKTSVPDKGPPRKHLKVSTCLKFG